MQGAKEVEAPAQHGSNPTGAAGYTKDELKNAVEYLKRGLIEDDEGTVSTTKIVIPQP
jgi:hypothetical protein